MTIGIYKITNTTNNKVYIGESLKIEKRWQTHKQDLENGNHHSYKLQEDYNTYGLNKFIFEIIEKINIRHKPIILKLYLLAYENMYIKEYNSINDGYNVENTVENIIKGNKLIIEDQMYLSESYIKQLIYMVNKIEGENLFLKCNNNYQKYRIFNDWCDNKNITNEELITLIFLFTHYILEKSMSLCNIKMIKDIIKINQKDKINLRKYINSLSNKNIIQLYDFNNKEINYRTLKDDKIIYVKLNELLESNYFEIKKEDVDKLFTYLENTNNNKIDIFKYFINMKRIENNEYNKKDLNKLSQNIIREFGHNKIEKYENILKNDLQLIK